MINSNRANKQMQDKSVSLAQLLARSWSTSFIVTSRPTRLRENAKLKILDSGQERTSMEVFVLRARFRASRAKKIGGGRHVHVQYLMLCCTGFPLPSWQCTFPDD